MNLSSIAWLIVVSPGAVPRPRTRSRKTPDSAMEELSTVSTSEPELAPPEIEPVAPFSANRFPPSVRSPRSTAMVPPACWVSVPPAIVTPSGKRSYCGRRRIAGGVDVDGDRGVGGQDHVGAPKRSRRGEVGLPAERQCARSIDVWPGSAAKGRQIHRGAAGRASSRS